MAEPTYKYSILNRPDFAFLYVQIPAGKTLKVEASAMATMTPNLEMKTKLKGGLGSASRRAHRATWSTSGSRRARRCSYRTRPSSPRRRT
jgi:uncharacterized protein (AIM24 family)